MTPEYDILVAVQSELAALADALARTAHVALGAYLVLFALLLFLGWLSDSHSRPGATDALSSSAQGG